MQRDIIIVKLWEMSVGFSAYRLDTGVILIGDVIEANQCLGLTEIKECHVRNWIVGKFDITTSHILYSAHKAN